MSVCACMFTQSSLQLLISCCIIKYVLKEYNPTTNKIMLVKIYNTWYSNFNIMFLEHYLYSLTPHLSTLCSSSLQAPQEGGFRPPFSYSMRYFTTSTWASWTCSTHLQIDHVISSIFTCAMIICLQLYSFVYTWSSSLLNSFVTVSQWMMQSVPSGST